MIDPNKPLWDYKVGDEIAGRKIKAIFGARPDYIIFASEDELTQILRNSIDTTPIQAHLERLSNLQAMAQELTSDASRQRIYAHLGRILKSCLDGLACPPPVTVFDEAELNIKRQLETEAKLVYIKASAILAIAWCAAAYGLIRLNLIPGAQVLPIVKGTIAGAAGSLASVVLRSSSIKVDSYTANTIYRVRGLCRVALGIIFGGFCVVAISAGFLFALAKDNVPLIWVMAFLAGFSERRLPEALENAEKAEAKGQQ
jgi:hypothetical protein